MARGPRKRRRVWPSSLKTENPVYGQLAFAWADGCRLANYIESAGYPAAKWAIDRVLEMLWPPDIAPPRRLWREGNHFPIAKLRRPLGKPRKDRETLVAGLHKQLRDDPAVIELLVSLLRGTNALGFRVQLD